jgi:zinc transport system ATP-binding protein
MPEASNAPSIAPPLVRIENLNVTLGGQPILRDVNLSLPAGGLHALIGPNGAGKTTLVRSIMGGLPYEGSVRFFWRGDGRLGYVPQLLEFDRALPMTVGDFITIMHRGHPVFLVKPRRIKKQVEEILAPTETDHLIDRKIGGLSGGELRRVLLAQALSPLPELLLLDEPASNVDEYGAKLFECILNGLRDKHGITTIMVGHDLGMINRVADTVTGIKAGVAFHGPPALAQDRARIDALFGAGLPGGPEA